MQFVITAYDAPNCLERRLSVRQAHLDNLLRLGGKLLCGGGMLDEEGKMKGSVIVVDFEDRAEVDRFLESEPYYTAKVWETVKVERMNVVFLKGEKVGK